ncbi:hypothetical protein [Streptomyces klenkii]
MDTHQNDAISDPPNDLCRTIPGNAINATNRTTAFAIVYKNTSCTRANRIQVLEKSGGMWDSGSTLVVAERVCFTAARPTPAQLACESS